MSAPLPPLKVGERRLVAPPTAGLPALEIFRTNPTAYVLRVHGSNRTRWASTIAEVQEDLAHFQATGALPPPAGTSWA